MSARSSSGVLRFLSPASPAGAATLLPSRSRPAPRGSRSPGPGPWSPRAARACARAARAAAQRCEADPRRSRGSLLRDAAEDAIYEAPGVLGGVALRERNGLVDRHLERHLAAVELEDREPEDVPLQRAEPVCGPLVGGLRDAPVELLAPLDDGFGELARVVVDLPFEERGELATGDVPLVQEHERGPARRTAASGHQDASAGNAAAASAR